MTDTDNPHGITAAERDKASAAARIHVTAFSREYGYCSVTVGGYAVGRVERYAPADKPSVGRWLARGEDTYNAPVIARGFGRRVDALRYVGRTDEAVLCYRTAALEGAFGWVEQSAAQARLDAALAPVLAPCAGSNRAAAHEWARYENGVYRCYRCGEPYIQKTRSR